jgi:cytochrome c biogenesis protein CcmG/thiol:disulfide interchange protein DsbE
VTEEAPPSAPPSRRRLWIAVGAVVVVALAAGGYFFGSSDTGGRQSGEGGIAPDFALPEVRGDGEVALADVRGKPVVVNFFAAWCVPCRKEMPDFQAVSSRLGDRVAFLGVDHQDNRDAARQLLADTGVRYPTGYDPDGTVAERYALFGMPTTLFISPDGRLLEKHTGELSEDKLEEAITRLFGISS